MNPSPPRPLKGRKILVTRAQDKERSFGALLEEFGAQALQIPVVRFEDPESWQPLDAALSDLTRYQRILFTSVTAVDRFFQRLQGRNEDRSLPPSLAITALGVKTRLAIQKWNAGVERTATSFRAEGVLEILPEEAVRGQEILFPRAEQARELLVEELTRRGARVTLVPVYRTRVAEENRELLRGVLSSNSIDVITFTAESAVRAFVELLGSGPSLPRIPVVACLGEVTAQAARSAGLHPEIIPFRSTLEDFAQAIAEYSASGKLGSTKAPG